jgi:hypothetical protein
VFIAISGALPIPFSCQGTIQMDVAAVH